jgi:hypothetical protein
MRSNLIDIEVTVHHETPMAFLVSVDGDRENAVWVPKSVVELDNNHGDGCVLTAPRLFLEEKGLL